MVIQGSKLMLFVGTGTSAVSIGYATNHTLSITSTSSEVTTKDSGAGLWTEATIQKFSWTTSTENLYSADPAGKSAADLYDLMVARTPIDVKFTTSSDLLNPLLSVPTTGWTAGTDTYVWSGKALITSLTINAPDGDNSSFTAEFMGVGALQKS